MDNTKQTTTTGSHLLENDLTDSRLIHYKYAVQAEVTSHIVHEVNTPLSVIRSRLFQLQQMLETNMLDIDKIQKTAEGISRAVDRIDTSLVAARFINRDTKDEKTKLYPLEQIVEDVIHYCRTRFENRGVEIRLISKSTDTEIECRHIQVTQCILSLMTNSFEAVQGLKEKWIELKVSENADKVQICVTDSGSPIDSEIAKNIFKPFFTTKDTQAHFGIGLSFSKEKLSENKAQITYTPNEKNCSFTIELNK